MSKKFSWWNEELTLLKPPEILTVSEVADKYRILGRGSSKPGKWETDFIPYLRSIMDAFAMDSIQEIWFVKPSQSGGTETLLNMLLYAALQDPGPTLIVEPTENLADEISQERLASMIQMTPELREIESPDDEPTKKKKVFQSMTVYLAWSNSPTSLASRPIRYCFFDEINKYKRFSGEEASPLALGKERTNTFIFNRKLVYVSTPTVGQGYVTRGEEKCEARFRYHVLCPHCGHKQILIFDQVQFSEFKDDLQKVERFSYYECERCKEKIFNDAKGEMVRRGQWIDLISGLPFDECLRKIKPKRIGFQINRLYSPWHSFGMVAREFLESKDYGEKLMNWKNSWMAEPWVERFETSSEAEIFTNTVDIPPLIIPNGCVAVTCGIDPSDDGFYFAVLAWRPDMSVHLVQYGFLPTWADVTSLVWESHYEIEGSDIQLPVWRAAVDTGGGQKEGKDLTMTEEAYDWLRRYGRGKVYGGKGMSHQSTHRIRVTKIDKTPKGKIIPGGIILLLIDSSSFKDAVHYRLQVEAGNPGRFTFHREVGEDFVSHLLSEEKRVDYKTGRAEWVKIRQANHWLDATVLAFVVADPELFGGVKIVRRPPSLQHQETSQTQSPKNFLLWGGTSQGWPSNLGGNKSWIKNW
jgi:phage terminase large subunit GpA-like protein